MLAPGQKCLSPEELLAFSARLWPFFGGALLILSEAGGMAGISEIPRNSVYFYRTTKTELGRLPMAYYGHLSQFFSVDHPRIAALWKKFRGFDGKTAGLFVLGGLHLWQCPKCRTTALDSSGRDVTIGCAGMTHYPLVNFHKTMDRSTIFNG